MLAHALEPLDAEAVRGLVLVLVFMDIYISIYMYVCVGVSV